jgi:asparagine synthase (glutamine-hydrolysing)
MCGIAGAVSLSPMLRPDRERVRRMSGLIAHRGPDADGSWEAPSGRAVFAHRRLSIIDLESGQQPMLDPTGQIGLVFNGEIYNYREVRQELRRRGGHFRTDSDTEVILGLYQESGLECVHELRGMFAFALWDENRGRLLLARDRLGKKPLYYTVEDGCLYFASSLHALHETATRRWEIDPAAVDSFLTLSYIPAPQTIFRGVHKLGAGTMLTVQGAQVDVRDYWSMAEAAEPFAGSYAEAVDRLDELVNTAVELRLRSDVPLGVFLSGGIDSSLVTAVAVRQSAQPVQTFSIGFDHAGFDESGYAARIAQHLGTVHHTFRARADLLHTLPEMVRHYGEPYADSSALATWLLARETRKHVTVALGGDGGDECFAGYDWYRTQARLQRFNRAVPEEVFALASQSLGGALRTALPRSRRAGQIHRGLATLGTRRGAPRFAALRSFVGPEEVRRLYAGELRELRRTAAGPTALLVSRYEECEGSELRRMRWVDITTYLADCLLPKVDVATMAHGLEARAPLLDQEILRFALSLPDEWMVDHQGGKKILKEVLHRYCPPELFARPKQGFSLPLGAWFRQSLNTRIEALPDSERLRSTGWLDPAGIRTLLAEQMAGLRDHSQRLYSLLVLDEWLRQHDGA